jgi:nucleotide-binding universal stress UspA family protein
MFNNILVPTDVSKKHNISLEIAVDMAGKYKSTVYLLHVIEIIPDVAFKEFAAFYDTLEKKTQSRMQSLISDFERKSLRIVPHIKYGNRVQEVLKCVNKNKIDLIIMNSPRGKAKSPDQIPKTISNEIALLTNIPVMLVK